MDSLRGSYLRFNNLSRSYSHLRNHELKISNTHVNTCKSRQFKKKKKKKEEPRKGKGKAQKREGRGSTVKGEQHVPSKPFDSKEEVASGADRALA